jgi:carotenoid 1,2-hydratase
LQHCAINVALYGATRYWAMTERGSAALRRGANTLTIGPSALTWDGEALTIGINERTAPFATRLRGQIRVRPHALTNQSFALDTESLHRWHPLAPCATVDVMMENPAQRWTGRGYLDCNDGDIPLERSFLNWHWSRAALADGTAILYDVVPHSGPATSLALHINHAGAIATFPAPPAVALPPTRWRIARATRADAGLAQVRQTLEDTPFYARSLLETNLLGETVIAVHESLSLTRFGRPWVQAMLPFRMPRVAGRR